MSANKDAEDPSINEYTLKDITPETLPAVRGIVSDVMLDIPGQCIIYAKIPIQYCALLSRWDKRPLV